MREGELRHLRDYHNELWQILLNLENMNNLVGDKWNILTGATIHEAEDQFSCENAQMTIEDYLKGDTDE